MKKGGKKMGAFLAVVIWSIFWGYVTNRIIHNKGYDENWFWWGFLFGLFAFVVALTKEDINQK